MTSELRDEVSVPIAPGRDARCQLEGHGGATAPGSAKEKLAIEVTTVAEACNAMEAEFDIIQLEKMTPDEVASIKDRANSGVLLAGAGGITPANVGAYVWGAGLIVSSWPYTAKPAASP